MVNKSCFVLEMKQKKAHVTQFAQATARGIDLARDKRHDCIFILLLYLTIIDFWAFIGQK